jgi:hypothetical protein
VCLSKRRTNKKESEKQRKNIIQLYFAQEKWRFLCLVRLCVVIYCLCLLIITFSFYFILFFHYFPILECAISVHIENHQENFPPPLLASLINEEFKRVVAFELGRLAFLASSRRSKVFNRMNRPPTGEALEEYAFRGVNTQSFFRYTRDISKFGIINIPTDW